MAKSIIIVSDLSGDKGAKTHRFSVDNVTYEVDLTDAEFADMEAAASRYVLAGRRVTGARPVERRAESPAATQGRRSRSAVAKIKAWGRENGWDVPERGRLPFALVRAYEAATGEGASD